VARVRALTAASDFEIVLVGLCRTEVLRDWDVPRELGEIRSTILSSGSYESVDKGRLWQSALEFLDGFRPDVLVLPGYGEGFVRRLARLAKNRGYATVMMSASQRSDRRRLAPVELVKGRWIRRHFDSAFVGGERATAYLEELGFPRDRIWRGFNVVDGEYFADRARAVRASSADWRARTGLPQRYFLYVGRLAPEKNLERLLRAYGNYRSHTSYPPWDLLLVGSGPQQTALQELVADLNIPGVHWVGHQQIDELPVYYALASGFVLPSLSEPWGLVINEAMASELPVLASSRCGATGDLVFPGVNGYVFDPGDQAGLAILMDRLASDPSRADGMGAASGRIIANYTPESWGRALADCIDLTLRRKRGWVSTPDDAN
jgi:glycosyltransferase involved in cell wall biosynthesis